MAAEKFAIPKDIIKDIQFKSKNEDFITKYYVIESGICKQDYTKCIAIERIIKMLQFYHNNHDNYGEIAKYLQDYKQYLMSDYHHILNDHLNEDQGSPSASNEQFKWIYDKLNSEDNNDTKHIFCDIGKCKIYSRNNREREKVNIECDDKKLSSFIDIMDTIHCYFMHSVDTGYRISHQLQQEMKQDNDTDDDEISEPDMKQLNSYLSVKRQKLRNLRGDHRFRNNKFMTDFSSSLELHVMPICIY